MVTPILPGGRENPLNRQQLNPAATPGAFGADIGAGMQDIGRGLFSVAGAFAAKEAMVAGTEADAAYNRFLALDLDIMRDPDTGFLNQTGENALNQRGSLEERRRAARASVEEGLSPAARRAFGRRADGLDNTRREQAITHESGELRNYRNAETDALITASLRAAGIDYDSDGATEHHLGTAIEAIDTAAALNGWDRTRRDNAVFAATSHVLSNRAIQMAHDDPIGADAYITENKDRIEPEQFDKLRSAFAPAVRAQVAHDTVQEFIRGNPGAETTGSPQNRAGAAALAQTAATTLGLSPEDQQRVLRQYQADGGANLDPAQRAWAASYINGIEGRVVYAMGNRRPARPNQDVTAAISRGVQAVIPGATVRVTSGKGDYGSQRHRGGHAADVQVILPDGSKLHINDPRMRAITVAVGREGITGFGAGSEYMGDHTVHMDNFPLDRYTPEMGRTWGTTGRQYREDFVNASAQGPAGPAAPGAATTPLTSSGVGSVLDRILALPDVRARDAALAEFTKVLQVQDAFQARQQQEMGEEAWRLFLTENVAPENLDMGMQIALGPQAMAGLISAAEKHRTGMDVTDVATHQSLLDMLHSPDPRVREDFVNAPLIQMYGDQLSRNDLNALIETQRELRQYSAAIERGEGASLAYKPEDYSAAVTAATPAFRAALGMEGGGTMKKEEHARFMQFSAQLKAAMQEYATTGQPMPQSVMDRVVANLLAPIILSSPGVLGMKRTEAQMFDAPSRARGASVTLDPDRMDVPHSERERIHDQLQEAYGRAISDEEIMQHATNEKLLEMGLQPEMEFRDVPKDLRNSIRAAFPGASDETVVDIFLQYALDSSQSDLLGRTGAQAERRRVGASQAAAVVEGRSILGQQRAAEEAARAQRDQLFIPGTFGGTANTGAQ